MRVAVSPTSSSSDQHAFAGLREIVEGLASVGIENHGSQRDTDLKIFAVLSMSVASFPMAAAVRAKRVVVTEFDECVFLGVGNHVDAAPVPAVSAAGPSVWNKFLAAKRNTPVSAVSCADSDLGFVNKHGEGR